MVEPVKLPDLKYILENVGDGLIQERENECGEHGVRIKWGKLFKEVLSTVSQVNPYEWFEYMLALKMTLKIKDCIHQA